MPSNLLILVSAFIIITHSEANSSVMEIVKNFIILFKAPKSVDEIDQFDATLRERGYCVKQVKTLDFQYKNLDLLQEKLKMPDSFKGIIFSSPRCVHAAEISLNASQLDVKWSNKHNYVVGSSTYETALKSLGLKCLGKESGNAKHLAATIINDEASKADLLSSYLYPHGNQSLDHLRNVLEPENITLDEVCVYDSIANPELEKDFGAATDNYKKLPEFIVFFSPSAVKAAADAIKKLPAEVVKDIKFIAIGPTTKKEILAYNLNVWGNPSHPTPVDLLSVIAVS